MPDLQRASEAGTTLTPNWLMSSFAMLSIMAATIVSIVALLQIVSWTECALLLAAGIVLSCGVLFTIVKMEQLSKEQ